MSISLAAKKQTALTKCDNTAFVVGTDFIPQVSQTLTTSFGQGNDGTAGNQCLVRQDYQFDAVNNSFAFNRVNGASFASGSLSFANANNEVYGARGVALGGSANLVRNTSVSSGTFCCNSVDLQVTGSYSGSLFTNDIDIVATGDHMGSIWSSGGAIQGTSSFKTILSSQNCTINGNGNWNHIAYSEFGVLNGSGSLNTIISCFTFTVTDGVKESAAFNCQSPTFNSLNARTGFFSCNVSTTEQSATNASCMNGELLTAWSVDQTVIGSGNFGTPLPTLANSGINDNWNLVIGNGNAATLHNAFSFSSSGIIRIQTNNNVRDPYVNTLDPVNFGALNDQDQSGATAGVKMFKMGVGVDSGNANAILVKFDNDATIYKLVVAVA